MKYRLTALIALTAVVALPAVASAAAMRYGDDYPSVSEATIMAGPVVTQPTGDSPVDTANAEHTYLANACPTVLAHPGSYSGVLDRFCQEFRG
jgi:hypothetical protein